MGVQFVPLTLELAYWFDRNYADLPAASQELLQDKLIWGTSWDSINPDQRRSVAAQWDYQNDPATETERKYLFDLWCKVDELETEFARLKDIRPATYEGDAVKRRELSSIRSQIERLMKLFDLAPRELEDSIVSDHIYAGSALDRLDYSGDTSGKEVKELGFSRSDLQRQRRDEYPPEEKATDFEQPFVADQAAQVPHPIPGSDASIIVEQEDPLDIGEQQLSETPNYLFVQKGDGWVIRFSGEEAMFRSLTGLHYFKYLLSHPGISIAPLSLHHHFNPSLPSEIQSTGYLELGLHQNGDSTSIDGMDFNYEVMNAKGIHQIRLKLKKLQEEVEDQKERGNTERVAELEDEIDAITRYVTRAKGLRGETRTFRTTADNIRSAITMNLNRTRKKISEHLPDLARHLERNITGKGGFCYNPEHLIDWKF